LRKGCEEFLAGKTRPIGEFFAELAGSAGETLKKRRRLRDGHREVFSLRRRTASTSTVVIE
jgi:hypothetical protein